MRPFIYCTICRDFEAVAKAHFKNGIVPMASGIKVDSQEKLQRVVTHIEAKGHEAAANAKIQHDLWNLRSEGHTWRKFLNNENKELINVLIKLAVDVYNDSLHDTLPAYNWASRSLAQIRAVEIVSAVQSKGKFNRLEKAWWVGKHMAMKFVEMWEIYSLSEAFFVIFASAFLRREI